MQYSIKIDGKRQSMEQIPTIDLISRNPEYKKLNDITTLGAFLEIDETDLLLCALAAGFIALPYWLY
jgi:hypothetical protein